MLCHICEDCIRNAENLAVSDDYSLSPHHFSLDSFYKSIQDECFICRHLWMSLRESQGVDDHDHKLIPRTFEDFHLMAPKFHTLDRDNRALTYLSLRYGDNVIIITAYQLGPSYERRYIRRFGLDPVSPDQVVSGTYAIGSPSLAYTGDTIQVWCNWFRACSETHSRCRKFEQQPHKFTPKKLIQLLPNDHGVISDWKLISSIGDVPYITLSHCWGSSQPTRLTKESLYEFSRPSSVLSLPKTYQHAIAIANSLKFQYLWIDSLCIVQDDDDDWKTQSRYMGLIYRNAACNIAATWATDSNDGCFIYRNPDTVRSCLITLHRAFDMSSIYQIYDDDLYGLDVVCGPLNSRGWVVQERHFARRQLNFAKHQVYWECYELVASEQFPSGLTSKTCQQKPTLDFQDERAIHQAWSKLVWSFSNSYLTRKSDKLYAISGLITELERLTGDSCIAGLWKTNLYSQLCWYSIGHPRLSVTTQGYVAPTWSWAHIDGSVSVDASYDDGLAASWIEVVDIDENPVAQEGSPTTVEQKIVIKGIALRGLAMSKSNKGFIANTSHIILTDPIRAPSLPPLADIIVDIGWDEVPSDRDRLTTLIEERNSDLLFLVVLHRNDSSKHPIQGLVLRGLPVSVGGDMKYERIGSFREHDGTNQPFFFQVAAMDAWGSVDLNDPQIADLVDIITIV
ncbi:heterokaryon incompatibility protein-domain-containing protein [Xylaria scruposa]|nr:heterokaryon incompatibility protein-domain-containing protein [Xylaria scruposa]